MGKGQPLRFASRSAVLPRMQQSRQESTRTALRAELRAPETQRPRSVRYEETRVDTRRRRRAAREKAAAIAIEMDAPRMAIHPRDTGVGDAAHPPAPTHSSTGTDDGG